MRFRKQISAKYESAHFVSEKRKLCKWNMLFPGCTAKTSVKRKKRKTQFPCPEMPQPPVCDTEISTKVEKAQSTG